MSLDNVLVPLLFPPHDELFPVGPAILTMPVKINNYLAERQQRVVINGMSSRSSHVLSGVPQGSILGPLLFLIYIDDITDIELSAGSNLVLYADDILLYRPIRNIGHYSALQVDIDALSSWATQNAMTFNITKCKSMTISRKRNRFTTAPPFSLIFFFFFAIHNI